MCTVAMCELVNDSPKDERLRKSAQAAIEYCLAAQNPDLGGWRYVPRNDSDTSVTGWMVLALFSGKYAGLDLSVSVRNIDGEVEKLTEEVVFNRIREYLDRAALDGGSQYQYQGSADPLADDAPQFSARTDEVTGLILGALPSMTAEGLVCRMYLGWTNDDPRVQKGIRLLLDRNLPRADNRDVYYWYYATQAMFHTGGDQWKTWNEAMRDLLIDSQVQEGREKGSWEPDKHKFGEDRELGPDYWAERKVGGRLYVTCLSVYMLEIYYRHLALFGEERKAIKEALGVE
jgi:hypothetical protein